MIVTGALADPRIGPDPTGSSVADLLWEADVEGLSNKAQNQPTATINSIVNLDLIIEISTTLSFQIEC